MFGNSKIVQTIGPQLWFLYPSALWLKKGYFTCEYILSIVVLILSVKAKKCHIVIIIADLDWENGKDWPTPS